MPTTIEGRIAELKSQLARAERELEIEKAKSPEIRLADLVHKIRCNSNHIDMCGWEYEKETDYKLKGTTRNRYYEQALKILDGEDIDTVTRIISKFADSR